MQEHGAKRADLDLEQCLTHLLEECRMVLPGIHALFGFQLVAVFNQPFWQLLSPNEQVAHFMALAVMALAMGFVLAPAVYHRLVEPNSVSAGFLRYASVLMSIAMGLLATGFVIDVCLIARLIFHSSLAGGIGAGILSVILCTLGFIVPFKMVVRK